jgi:uncharacterized protein (TIGR02271 family)
MDDSAAPPVITKDGVRGVLPEGIPADSATTHVLVRLDDGRQLLAPKDALVLQAGGRYYYLAAEIGAESEQIGAETEQADESFALPVIAEELDVQRRRVETGRVRITKLVHEREETVDEPLLREVVEVERVPIDRVVDAVVEPRQEGDTLIIPVLEERLVVTRQLVLREELRITRRRSEERRPQQVTLRSEEVLVERLGPGDENADGGTERAHGQTE